VLHRAAIDRKQVAPPKVQPVVPSIPDHDPGWGRHHKAGNGLGIATRHVASDILLTVGIVVEAPVIGDPGGLQAYIVFLQDDRALLSVGQRHIHDSVALFVGIEPDRG